MFWSELVAVLSELRPRIRAVRKSATNADWSDWLTMPAPGYVELSDEGPIKVDEIVALEIDPVVSTHRGRLLAPRLVDHREVLLGRLRRLTGELSVNSEGNILVAPPTTSST